MPDDLSVDLVSRLYLDGVSSVERIAAGLSNDAWELPVCGRWTGTQTARHLLAVARWYHGWLDRAIAEFAETATAYLGRATENWNLAYGNPYGTVTTGLHSGARRSPWPTIVQRSGRDPDQAVDTR